MSTARDFLNSKAWCYKMEEFVFKKADIDGDGYISPEDRKASQACFRDYVQKQGVNETALEALKAATEEILSAFGTESDRVSKDDWLKKVAELAAADLEKIKKAEEPLLVKTAGPLFDIMDTDKDGFITLEDFKLGYAAIGWDAVSAEYAFRFLDKTNSGKISRKEFVKSSADFWYKIDPEPQQPSTAHDFLNSKAWCYKMEEFVFKKADIDGDGYISPEDRKASQACFRDYAQKQGVNETALEAHKVATEEIVSAFGTESDRVSKDDWLKKVAELAAADLEKIKKGEEPLLVKNAGPLFDVMDTDKDGFITLEDFKLGYAAIGWDAVSAEYAFKFLDRTNSGKISRKEFVKSSPDFWYKIDPEPQQPSTAQDFLNSNTWCYKMEEFVFKKADIDGDGYISPEDRKASQACFRDYAQKQGVNKTALEAHKAATEEIVSAFSTESDQVSKDDWLKKVAELAAADLEKIKKGEEPLLVKNAGPLFDVMDTDKDGFIMLEDFKLGYAAIGWDAVSAEYAFKFLDKTNSGKISRKEFVKSSPDFWYKIDPEPQ